MNTEDFYSGYNKPVNFSLRENSSTTNSIFGTFRRVEDLSRGPPELRRQMVELARAGHTPEQLSCEFELSALAISNWVKQAGPDRVTAQLVRRAPSAESEPGCAVRTGSCDGSAPHGGRPALRRAPKNRLSWAHRQHRLGPFVVAPDIPDRVMLLGWHG